MSKKKHEVKESGREPSFHGQKVGSTITREYKGKTLKVLVKADGFHLGGVRYTSLSKLASEQTGNSTNGPLWFGLRAEAKPAKKSSKKAAKAKAPKKSEPAADTAAVA